MKFISAEEFLNQPKEIQKVFIDWWKPSEGDIYSYIDLGENCRECISQGIIQRFKRVCNKIKITLKEWLNCIPLLTEGQLRELIEDKTNCKIDWCLNESEKRGDSYELTLEKNYKIVKQYQNLCIDLLKAYWKVALKIAKENVENE